MANDDRYGRGTEWRGDPAFGRGWGNQAPRMQRPRDRDWRDPGEDIHAGGERYGRSPAEAYDVGEITTDPAVYHGALGYDPEYGGPRFDPVDLRGAGVHPNAARFSTGQRSVVPGGYTGGARRFADDRGHDPQYVEWRRRQIEELDRDYDEYRREHQSRFDREFGAWRTRRGEQREALGRIAEHMEMIGSDDSHVGTVDCTRDDRIVLTKSDASAGGVHHMIPCGWIERVDDKVRLNLTAEEAMQRWQSEHRSRALFEREDSGSRGPHMLNRSFAGTYRNEE